jgi:transposase
MVALTAVGVAVKAVSIFVQRSVRTVHRWLRRSETIKDFGDLPRSGRPAIYSEETKLRVVAFYCQTHPLPDCGRWSLRWAARYLEGKPGTVGVSPSKSTLHRILKSNQLKPHQSHYFLHVTDPDFFPKMEHLVALYRNPPRHLFFFDECPGIQVLKRLMPDLQTDTMKQRLEEFEYIRNGTLDVFAFLNHADGKVALEFHAEHSAETFVEVFTRHTEQYANTESLHYVMDNLYTHTGYLFCQTVATLSGVDCPPKKQLKTQIERRQWLGQEDKRIVIHFTPFHGSWLNMVEIWFGILNQKVLGESFGAPSELKAALEAFGDDWNHLWAHPFKWSYDGNGLHSKAVKRFTKMLCLGVETMELRYLTRLLKLMANLLTDYFSLVPAETWNQFITTFNEQYESIYKIIQTEKGPERKKKAQQALSALLESLQLHFSRNSLHVA